MGVLPPKGQQMEDHYFGSIHPRALSFMEDVAEMMGSLGMVVKTRHNEVAPCQFEFAPQFSEANLAVDQNQILMEQMRRLARQHGLRLLLHEKPFPSINGSGKHMNFSLVDSEGRNLLKPPTNQRKSLQFLTLLSSLLIGVAKYGGLLRASVATPGNMHRLGGNEAPPAIISVYLGDVLTQIMTQIEKGLPDEMPSKGLLDIGLSRLPTIRKENTDRNRTAPLAFTGDKFEFRAPGASQSPAGPLTMILAVWAWGMDQLLGKIESRLGSTDIADAALDAIRWAIVESKNIRFEGNCYSPEWVIEAKRRGLPIAETTYDALRLYLEPEHMELLSSLGIMTEKEIASLFETKIEQYNKTLEIEMTVMESMVWEGVLPAISKQICLEGNALKAIEHLNTNLQEWQEQLGSICEIKNNLLKSIQMLSNIRVKAQEMSSDEQSEFLTNEALPFMEGIRGMCDAAEKTIASEYWPYPRYRELLTLD
jgi:glutamine synthetase